MISSEALRRRLDNNFQSAQHRVDTAAVELRPFSQDDMHSFNSALRQLSTASWAASQEVVVKHNLTKAILNEIR
ncbi:type III secretion protein HrpF [Pseudomonas fluorescens]|uniref:type III secretion protein HrpF n=1 Tax=Pseudomonas fluorescens TaxID=294 RepID=UPI001BEA3D84|nr:type III secretion protein HrpF [Pseudomonas fluorescens]MBT2375470.1 serine kinase [Pseudomonas fluorescens]